MKSRMYPLAFILLCGALFAAEPIPIKHFGEIEGRVMGQIAPPEKAGDLIYSLNAARTDVDHTLYLSTERSETVVQIIAHSDDQDSQRFMVRLRPSEVTAVDLSELEGYRALLMLSRGSFDVTLSDGETLRSYLANEQIYPGRNPSDELEPDAAPIQLKSSCTLRSQFITLVCNTPSTCGTLSFNASGRVETDCPFSGALAVSWGCHAGFKFSTFVPTTVTTNSGCGCYGTAYWEVDQFYRVWYVNSICPGGQPAGYLVF